MAPDDVVDEALSGPAGRAALLEALLIDYSRRAPEFDAVLDELARRAAGGDDTATELVLEVTHRLQLARPAVTAVVLNAAMVDDVLQNTLITVERKLDSYEGRSKYRTWLHTVARNEALMALRRRQDEPVEELPPRAGRFSSMLVGRMSVEALVDRLSEPYRETLRLQAFEGLEYDAIAARLDVPIGTVRSRLSKARELLRAELAAE